MSYASTMCILINISLATHFRLFSANILCCIGFIEIYDEICAEDALEVSGIYAVFEL